MKTLHLPTLLLLLFACACRAPETRTEDAALRRTIDELYAAFCFDPEAEPDWETQRRIYLEGACFVPPIAPDRAPRGESEDEFLTGFREYVTTGPYRATGLHERILHVRVDLFGGVAHAFVAFEGFVPGEQQARTRGLDSLQLVHDGEAWRLAGFATQYEREGLALPERFLSGDGRGACCVGLAGESPARGCN